MSRFCFVLAHLTCLAVSGLAADSPTGERFSRRWISTHPGFNLQRDDQADQLIELIHRGEKAGYNGVVFGTSQLQLLQVKQPRSYYVNAERVRMAAEEAGVELIPRVMGINGYSNDLLSNDPHLAPALPVRECVMQIQNGQATVANAENLIPGGTFENFSLPNRPDGFGWLDVPGKVSFKDQEVRHSGKASIRMEHFETATEHGNCRLFKKLILKPWHQYHLTAWIKSEKIVRAPTIGVQVHGIVDQQRRINLQKRSIDVQATQDWTEHHAVFNTLEYGEVWLYIGGWNPGGGKLWIDDVSLHEVAGINLLRREGCPIKVTSDDGSVTYEEGRDFDRWEYPKMGRDGRPGRYEIAHPQPPIVLTNSTRIRDNQKLNVSYYHTQMHMNSGVGVCLSHDDVFKYLTQHLQAVQKLYRPKTYLMHQDEIRLAGWCELCSRPGTTTGQVLAQCTKRCTEIIRKLDPNAEIVVWNDMFDPFHNAVDNYWLTRGTMKGSWEGVDKTVSIGNWNQGQRRPSLKFFAGRGHRQIIATYYDRGDNWKNVVNAWLAAAEGIPNVDGIMYTTWSNNYDDLEEFIQLVHPD
jgi:hypothetical protein